MGDAGHNREPSRFEREYVEIASLAGGLAHEIRNPLSTIRMNLELLFEDVQDAKLPAGHRIERKLRTIQRECGHLEEILEAFLQFSRAGELTLEPVDLAEPVREFIDFHRPEAASQRIDVRLHLATGLPRVALDRTLFRQVLANLVRNAQQAMPEGGSLELQAYSRGDDVILEVIDSGCGITPAARERIFDAFFSTKPGGSGLGLPTVRKIVEAHRGTIRCDSEPGRGTRFTITLPAIRE